MRQQYLINICIFLVVVIIAVFLYKLITLTLQKKKAAASEFYIKAGKTKNSAHLLNIYNKLQKFEITRRYLEKLRRTYEMRLPGNTRANKEAAMKLALIAWCIDALAIVVCFIIGVNLYHLGCVMLTAYVLTTEIANSQLRKFDSIILNDLDRFIDLVQFYYFNIGMVDEALLAAIQNTKSEFMKAHGQLIYDVLLETEYFEEAIKEYNLMISNTYIKSFAEAIFDTFQYGDVTVDEESQFLVTIRNIKNGLREESLALYKLKSELAGASICVLLPIYSLDLIKDFECSSFSAAIDIFEGSYGLIATFALLIMDFCAIKVVAKMSTFTRVEPEGTFILDKLYSIRYVKRAVNTILNRNWGKAMKIKDELKKIGSNLTIYQFTTKRMMLFVVMFIAGIVLSNYAHVYQRNAAKTQLSDISKVTNGASDEDAYAMMLIGKGLVSKYVNQDIRGQYNKANGGPADAFFDDEVCEWFTQVVLNDIKNEGVDISFSDAYVMGQQYLEQHQGTSNNLKYLEKMSEEEALNSEDELVKVSVSYINKKIEEVKKPDALMNDDLNQKIADTVVKKIQTAQSSYFSWVDVVLSALLAILGYMFPVFYNQFQKKALQMDMIVEVIQFQSIILLLMNFGRMTAVRILERMLMFANVFESSIRTCINDMPLDEFEAYDRLIEEEPYEPFVNLIECMRMSDKVGIKAAFGGVKSDMKNYQAKRAVEIDMTVQRRKTLLPVIVSGVFSIIITVYMVAPIAMAAIGELTESMGALNDATGTSQ